MTNWREYLDPRPIVLVTSVDAAGKPNVFTVAWSMPTSFDPALLAISAGHQRYSHELIAECGEFVVNVPDRTLKDLALQVGGISGRKADKFAKFRIATQPAQRVKPPVIADCLAAIECVVVDSLLTGDHTIFIGRVAAAYPLQPTFDPHEVLMQGMYG